MKYLKSTFSAVVMEVMVLLTAAAVGVHGFLAARAAMAPAIVQHVSFAGILPVMPIRDPRITGTNSSFSSNAAGNAFQNALDSKTDDPYSKRSFVTGYVGTNAVSAATYNAGTNTLQQNLNTTSSVLQAQINAKVPTNRTFTVTFGGTTFEWTLNSNGTFTLPQASTSVSGWLSSTDWNTFNNKTATNDWQSSNSTLQAAISAKVAKAGDTMTGQLGFSGTTHAGLVLLSLTTTQRDALTPAAGMMIYNSTNNRVEKYQAGAWTATEGPGGTGIVSLGGQTNSVQTFGTDGIIGVSSAGDVHTPQLTGIVTVAKGGTGTNAFPANSLVYINALTNFAALLGVETKIPAYTNGAWAMITPPSGGGTTEGIAILEYAVSDGTDGNAGSTGWLTRPLNRITYDSTGSIVTDLTTNAFELATGTYDVEVVAVGYNVGRTKLRLRNVTDGTTIFNGLANYTSSGSGYTVTMHCPWTNGASAKKFSIEQYVSTTETRGFGLSMGIGEEEKYITVKFRKRS